MMASLPVGGWGGQLSEEWEMAHPAGLEPATL